jgi:hypothetical protein
LDLQSELMCVVAGMKRERLSTIVFRSEEFTSDLGRFSSSGEGAYLASFGREKEIINGVDFAVS